MKTKMTMIYWKGEKFWLGKLLEHPEIMTQVCGDVWSRFEHGLEGLSMRFNISLEQNT